MKSVFIKTYGCQMNERDSEAVGALLRGRGYSLSLREDDADVIVMGAGIFGLAAGAERDYAMRGWSR